MECLRLRVKDIDFVRHQIPIRDGKGQKDRVTMLSDRFSDPLKKHLESVKAVKASVCKKVGCHTLRHSEGYPAIFCGGATHLLEAVYDIPGLQELLGHGDISTTMICTHVLNRPGISVKSPADF